MYQKIGKVDYAGGDVGDGDEDGNTKGLKV